MTTSTSFDQDQPDRLRSQIRSLLSKGDVETLAALHGHGVWKDLSPKARLTQLQLAPGAVRKNVPKVLAFLLEQGLDPHQLDPQGQCIFHHVFLGIKDQRAAWLDAFEQAGVPLTLANADGQTGLSMAAQAKQPELVQRFIEAGVELSDADRVALQKADCAASLVLLWNTYGKDRSQQLLDKELVDACRSGLQGQAWALLDIGAQPSLHDEKKNLLTLLGNRAGLKSALVQRLVRLGVDPSQPALDGANQTVTFTQQIQAWKGASGRKTSNHWIHLEKVVRETRHERLEQVLDAPTEPVRRPRM